LKDKNIYYRDGEKMLLNESQLREIIKEEMMKMFEADIIRRRAGVADVRKTDASSNMDDERRPSSIPRSSSGLIEKFQFIGRLYDKAYKMKRAYEEGFIAPSPAYTAKYNQGVEKFSVSKVMKNQITGEDERYRRTVHVGAIKPGDVVVIPELYAAGVRGVGTVLAVNSYRNPDVVGVQGGIPHDLLERNQSVPVATVKFESSQTDTGNVESTLQNIGWAFLLKVKPDNVSATRNLFKKN
jgi:hypothetical protein